MPWSTFKIKEEEEKQDIFEEDKKLNYLGKKWKVESKKVKFCEWGYGSGRRVIMANVNEWVSIQEHEEGYV